MEAQVKTKCVSFHAVIRKEGINPYVDPPLGTGKALGVKRGTVPVKVILEGKNFQANLVQLGVKRTKAAPGTHHRLYLHGIMRKSVGKETGDRVHIELRRDIRPQMEPMNPGLARAFKKDAKAKTVFEGLSPSRQKELKRYLNNLKSPEALQRNVDKVMGYLRQSRVTWFGKKKPVQ